MWYRRLHEAARQGRSCAFSASPGWEWSHLKNVISTMSKLSFKKLARSFFRRGATEVAAALIGKILVRHIHGKTFQARIVETEAYLGPDDLASHASKGRTRRTEVLFGPAGRAYVYLIYGIYEMLNVVAGRVGDAQGVLIRAAQPLNGWKADLSGPGRLTRAFQITRSQNGLDLTGDQLHFLNDPSYHARVVSAKRIGIDYAGEWKDAPLRFLDANHSARNRLAEERHDPVADRRQAM
jgi:DNA-3-methyladenine glycosylase